MLDKFSFMFMPAVSILLLGCYVVSAFVLRQAIDRLMSDLVYLRARGYQEQFPWEQYWNIGCCFAVLLCTGFGGLGTIRYLRERDALNALIVLCITLLVFATLVLFEHRKSIYWQNYIASLKKG